VTRREIPLFPLSNVVLFPGVQAPLHIFEPRYRQMMEAALGGERSIGMVVVHPQHQLDMGGEPPIFDVGCAGFIARHERLADGRYHLVLEGTQRFRVVRERVPEGERLFRIGEVEMLPEADPGPGAIAALRESVIEMIEPLLDATPEATVPLDRLRDLDDPTFVNALCAALGLPCEEKQALLEAAGPEERLEKLEGVLQFHLASARAPAGAGPGRVH